MVSVYLHIPFCTHRCAYCDFNTYAGQEAMIPAYVQALCREIQIIGENFPGLQVCTIFFGGGTPSLLALQQLELIFAALHANFHILPDAEISLEANPGTVNLEALRGLRALGFNRISFGVQSFHPDELRQLERIHDPFDVFEAVNWARRAGFDNLNLDLIYGLPEQPLDRWSATLRWAISLAPKHLSLYALTLEHGTPFGRWAARGLLPLPDPDLAAEMYECACERLEAQGYLQYEISNWAKDTVSGRLSTDNPTFACRHNLTYWRGRPYLGFGAGAHGYWNSVRYSNVLRIKTYIERLIERDNRSPTPFPAAVSVQSVDLKTQMQEVMMLGLRLTREGVSRQSFADRFGVEMTDVFGREISELLSLGLVEWMDGKSTEVSTAGDVLRLTRRARLLGNQVFLRFVGD
ncbi:MAG: radical SAM family heme chaperone HemW [Anaerolineales bacterium]|nr:radical SAM family heme chaperone HemW [Anaerolineales bacterium]